MNEYKYICPSNVMEYNVAENGDLKNKSPLKLCILQSSVKSRMVLLGDSCNFFITGLTAAKISGQKEESASDATLKRPSMLQPLSPCEESFRMGVAGYSSHCSSWPLL